MSEIMKQESMSIDTIDKMAEAMANSGMFGVTKKDDMFSLMLLSQAEGKHPALCAKEYHIVKGKPTLKADAMLARFQNAGGKVQYTKYTDECVAMVFNHVQGGKLEVEWTIERAKKAGLTSNPTWAKYARAMLKARCITEGIRAIYPAICTGIYEESEVRYDDGIVEHTKDKPLFKKSEEVEVEADAVELVSDDDINALLSYGAKYNLVIEDLQNYFKVTLDLLPKDRATKILDNPDVAMKAIADYLDSKDLKTMLGDSK